jgi:hypothetical protein
MDTVFAIYQEYSTLLLSLVVWILFAGLATAIGYYKGKILICFIFGVMLGPFGMLIAIWISEKTKNCPNCHATIQLIQLTCDMCGCEFPLDDDYQTKFDSVFSKK